MYEPPQATLSVNRTSYWGGEEGGGELAPGPSEVLCVVGVPPPNLHNKILSGGKVKGLLENTTDTVVSVGLLIGVGI